MSFEYPTYASLFILLLLLVARMIYLYNWKKRAQASFADAKMAKKIFQFSNVSAFIRSNLFLLLIVFLLILALMDLVSPGEKQEVEIQGADIVFCLDLSNSMNAEDVLPSRLEKAKLIIESTLEKTANDRVGLVVFAYDAYPIIPLTQDYEAVSSYLSTVQTTDVLSQGTRFKEAILAASKLFKKEDLTTKNVVLISDGEDLTNDVDQAAELADENNMRIISVGIGTTKGSVIPEIKHLQNTGLILDENGKPVVSKLDEKSLKEMATETQGKFIYATNTDNTSLQIRQAIKAGNNTELNIQEAYVANHHFQWFVGLALLLIIIVSLTNIQSEFNI